MFLAKLGWVLLYSVGIIYGLKMFIGWFKHKREGGEILLQISFNRWYSALIKIIALIFLTPLIYDIYAVLTIELPLDLVLTLILPSIFWTILCVAIWGYSVSYRFEIREKVIFFGFPNLIPFSTIKDYEWTTNLLDKDANNILLLRRKKRSSFFASFGKKSSIRIPKNMKDTVTSYLEKYVSN